MKKFICGLAVFLMCAFPTGIFAATNYQPEEAKNFKGQNISNVGDLDVDGTANLDNTDIDGTLSIQPSTDSTTAVQVLDADGGAPVLNIDTTNEFIGIGTNSPGQKLTIYGPDSSAAGPNIRLITAADAYPQLETFVFAHDNIAWNFDCYWNGSAWKSSDAGSNFQIYKIGDTLAFNYGSGDAAGADISGGALTTGLMLNTSGNVGIATTAPDARLEINHATGDNLRLTYNDADGTATYYADLQTSASGDLTVTPSGGDMTVAANHAATTYTADASATPGITLIDSDTTDEDDSAIIYANATDTATTTEDVDVYLRQQVAGTMTTAIFADADGNLELGTAAQDTEIKGSLTVDGTLHGKIEIIADDTSLSAAQCYGSLNKLNGAETVTLPAAVAGMNVLLYSDDANVKTIDPNGTDHIWLNGVDNGAGNSIDSPAAVGDYIVLVAFSDNNWYSVGQSGVWIDTP
ncbi:MAG: hypothetical protein HN929_09430 [Chloroflexi bacterium]|nr:hypothetical protein [Chloroflexota bacterium]